MLKIGNIAPDFTLPDAEMNFINFASLRDRYNAVLFFYPKDGTPYCTQEAIEFSDHEDDFLQLDTRIFGISRDDCLSHARFADAHGISFPLLSDEDGAIGHRYSVYHFRELNGRKKLMVVRSTFVIDKKGIVRHALYDVNPKGHAAEVLALVREMNSICQS